MLQTYTMNTDGVALTSGDAVQFNVKDVDTCNKLQHIAGTPTIEINKSGYYQITFSSFGYNTGAVVEGTAYSGMYAFQLENKGVPVANAIASAASASDTEIENVGFSVIVRVPPSCCAVNNNAVLTVNYLGQEGVLLGANLTVVKLN